MSNCVRKLQESDINQVAEVHRLIFPDARSTRIGKRYVRKMFQWFYESQPDLSFVSTWEDRINGYVIGAIGGYGRKVFRYAFLEIVFGWLTHPKLWTNRAMYKLWHSYIQGLNPFSPAPRKIRSDNPAPKIKRAALAGIGVLPSARGQGIGKLLLDTFEKAALSRGAKLLGLSVEIDNISARKLYEQNGWKIDLVQSEQNSIHYSKIL